LSFWELLTGFPPSKVFFYSAIFGTLFNLGILIEITSAASLLMLSFLQDFPSLDFILWE